MALVVAEFTGPSYAQAVSLRHHRLLADEVQEYGGEDAGPSPTELLHAAVASCVTITLQMYARRKGWDLAHARVEVDGRTVDGVYVIERRLTLQGELSDEQRARLSEIAGRCPVSRRITGPVEIRAVDERRAATGTAGSCVTELVRVAGWTVPWQNPDPSCPILVP